MIGPAHQQQGPPSASDLHYAIGFERGKAMVQTAFLRTLLVAAFLLGIAVGAVLATAL